MDNVNLWTDDGDYVYWSCQNAYGSGACLAEADSNAALATYTTVVTVTATPYVQIACGFLGPRLTLTMNDRSHSPPTMAGDLTAAPPSDSPFTIPPMPTSFYPGATPVSTLLSLSAAGGL